MVSDLKNLSAYNPLEIPSAKGFRFAIVCSEWNNEITNQLTVGCIKTLEKHGAKNSNIKVFHVPGSFELTFACSELVKSKNFDAIIAIGCIIEGETRHFEFIAAAVANGITQLNALRSVPVIFGVLTPANQQQAIDRAGGKFGNKGVEAAITAIKMIALKMSIRKKKFKILVN